MHAPSSSLSGFLRAARQTSSGSAFPPPAERPSGRPGGTGCSGSRPPLGAAGPGSDPEQLRHPGRALLRLRAVPGLGTTCGGRARGGASSSASSGPWLSVPAGAAPLGLTVFPAQPCPSVPHPAAGLPPGAGTRRGGPGPAGSGVSSTCAPEASAARCGAGGRVYGRSLTAPRVPQPRGCGRGPSPVQGKYLRFTGKFNLSAELDPLYGFNIRSFTARCCKRQQPGL